MVTTESGRLPGSRKPSPSSTGLGPSGFDPGRCAFLARCVTTKKALLVGFTHSTAHLDELVEVWTPYGFTAEFTVVPRDFVESGKDWLRRTIDKAANLPWVRKEAFLAIATEAHRAETENTDSVHEGAGRQASPDSGEVGTW